MKKILLAVVCLLSLSAPSMLLAQTATFTSDDTVYATIGGTGPAMDTIVNTAYTNGLVLKWHVVDAHDFPADWLTLSAFGICDNNVCRYNTGDTALWNSTTSTGASFVSNTFNPYHLNADGLFYLSLNLTTATTLGSHWITIALKDTASSYSKNVTFVINKVPTSVPTMKNVTTEVVLYPNPASNELNVVYDASADVTTIALYNIIGKVINVYKVNNSSANLDLGNVPAGVYFVRLSNSGGNVVATRKFTKQ